MTAFAQIDDDLPGAELVAAGVRDLAAGRRSVEALLVAQARTRLRAAGIPVPDNQLAEPEAGLYRLLEERDPDDAYTSYNALRARLVSFCEAAEKVARGRQR